MLKLPTLKKVFIRDRRYVIRVIFKHFFLVSASAVSLVHSAAWPWDQVKHMHCCSLHLLFNVNVFFDFLHKYFCCCLNYDYVTFIIIVSFLVCKWGKKRQYLHQKSAPKNLQHIPWDESIKNVSLKEKVNQEKFNP